jgi:hypothetical protein
MWRRRPRLRIGGNAAGVVVRGAGDQSGTHDVDKFGPFRLFCHVWRQRHHGVGVAHREVRLLFTIVSFAAPSGPTMGPSDRQRNDLMTTTSFHGMLKARSLDRGSQAARACRL